MINNGEKDIIYPVVNPEDIKKIFIFVEINFVLQIK
jgi:hypothetical protein